MLPGKEELSEKFRVFLRRSERYGQAHEIAARNSKGGLWLVGSFLYENLAEELYGDGASDELFEGDVDFVGERPMSGKIYIPAGWEFHMNVNYANPYFENGMKKTDLNYLVNFRGVKYPTIEHFLGVQPFNICTIVFDCKNKAVIGKRAGVEAINRKTIKVNNYGAAKEIAGNRGITIEKLLKEKAEQIGHGFKSFKRYD